MKRLVIYTDGLCEPNPGLGTWAFVVYEETEKGRNRIYGDWGTVKGKTTNNVAEYIGFGKALKYLRQTHPEAEITIFTDSKLVMSQVLGEWQCNKDELRKLRDRCRELLTDAAIDIKWVPSAENLADKLTRLAYYQARGHWPPVRNNSRVHGQS